jgi:hypothetical protein
MKDKAVFVSVLDHGMQKRENFLEEIGPLIWATRNQPGCLFFVLAEGGAWTAPETPSRKGRHIAPWAPSSSACPCGAAVPGSSRCSRRRFP